MNSFWSIVSPLRFFRSAGPVIRDDDQATTDGVPGDVRVEPSAPAYESIFENSAESTPASFLYSGGSSKKIIKSFETGSPTSPVDKVLDPVYLAERLKHLQMLEQIEDKEQEIIKKRSLRLSQLQYTSAPPMDADMRNVLDQVASSTRLMAFSQRKAIEKDAGENSKLKSLETLQILHFYPLSTKIPSVRRTSRSIETSDKRSRWPLDSRTGQPSKVIMGKRSGLM